MTHEQFKRALEVAESDADLSKIDDSNLFGYGLPDFKPATTTVEAVAKTIRWQARFLNGNWDAKELDSVRRFGKNRFLVVN